MAHDQELGKQGSGSPVASSPDSSASDVRSGTVPAPQASAIDHLIELVAAGATRPDTETGESMATPRKRERRYTLGLVHLVRPALLSRIALVFLAFSAGVGAAVWALRTGQLTAPVSVNGDLMPAAAVGSAGSAPTTPELHASAPAISAGVPLEAARQSPPIALPEKPAAVSGSGETNQNSTEPMLPRMQGRSDGAAERQTPPRNGNQLAQPRVGPPEPARAGPGEQLRAALESGAGNQMRNTVGAAVTVVDQPAADGARGDDASSPPVSANAQSAPIGPADPALIGPGPSFSVAAPSLEASISSGDPTSRSAAALPDRIVPSRPAHDDEAVRDALNQYVSGNKVLDVGAVAAVWPSVDRGALARAFATLNSQTINLSDCDIKVLGASATVHCFGSVEFVPKIGARYRRTEQQEWLFRMDRSGANWMIRDIDVGRPRAGG